MPNQSIEFKHQRSYQTFLFRIGLIGVLLGSSGCTSLDPTQPDQAKASVYSVGNESSHDSSDRDFSSRQPTAAALAKSCAAPTPNADSSALLQACLDGAPDGATVSLQPAIYNIGKMLHVDHSITITTASGQGVCRDNSQQACAELRAMPTVANMDRGFLKITAAHVTLTRIVVNGNNNLRQNSREAAQCRAGNNGQGINIHVDGTQFTFSQSTTMRALCGSGLEVGGVSEGLRITQSFVSQNGIHNLQSLWSDGVTIADSINAEIGANEISDNTDVDLIFGGCKSCQIHDNQISHSNSFAQSSFAAMMMQAWPKATSGDYSGSSIINNRIDCGHDRCGFGLLIGSNSWYVAPAFGGTYRGNHISGAQSGFVINDATGTVEIGNNVVDQSGGRFLTSGGVQNLAAYALSPKSAPFIVWADAARSYPWQAQEGTGKIANWWTTDSTGAGGESSSGAASTAGDYTGVVPSCSQLAAPISDSQFVLHLYCQILGREPDSSGFSNWITQVSTSHDRTGLLVRFFLSPESLTHSQIQLNDPQNFVSSMYQRILSRPVDPSGLKTWVNRMNSGSSAQTVLQLLLQNPEPKQAFGL